MKIQLKISGSKFTKAFVAACSLFVLSGLGSIPNAWSAGTPAPSITLQPDSRTDKITRARDWVKSAGDDADAYGEAILNSLQPPCVLLVLEDIPTLSLWSLKEKGRIPEGVKIYDFDGTFFQTLPALSNISGDLPLDALFRARESAERKLIESSPVPVYSTARRDSRDLVHIRQVPCGLSYRFVRDNEEIPDYRGMLDNMKSQPLETGKIAALTAEQQNMRAVYHFMRALNWMGLSGVESRDSARLEFLRSQEFSGEMKGIYAMLSEYFLQLGDGEDALITAKIAVARKPEYPKSHFVLGDAYSFQKELVKSAAAYEMGLNMGFFFPDAAYKLAGVYQKLQQYDKAISLYEKILTQPGNWDYARKNLADTYLAHGDKAKALETYKAYLKTVKSSSEKKEIRKIIRSLGRP